MGINTYAPSTFTTSVLIADTYDAPNGSVDAIPTLTIENGAPVDAALEIRSTKGGLLVPRMTTAERDDLNSTDGMLLYNTNTNQFDAKVNGNWITAASGAGNVSGPAVSVVGNIAIFNNITGDLISDSGVSITAVPAPGPFGGPLVTVNQIGNLGNVQFVNGVGLIFVDTLLGVQYLDNNFGPGSQVCSLITGELPGSSTTPSALLELQSSTGALLISRMTTSDRDALLVSSPDSNGMLVYDKTVGAFYGRQGGIWAQFNTSGGSVTQINSGTGITCSPDPITAIGSVSISDTGITAGDYTVLNATVNAQGQLTVVSSATTIIDTFGVTDNLFIGFSSGTNAVTGTENIGIGNLSEASLTSGRGNVGIGLSSLGHITIGTQNTAVGTFSASGFQVNLNSCTFLGYGAGVYNDDLINACAIGASARVSTSNSLLLGNGCNVGINQTSPIYTLHISNVGSNCAIKLDDTTSIPSSPAFGTGGILYTSGDDLYYANSASTINLSAGGSGTVTSVGTGYGLTGGPITTTGTISFNLTQIIDTTGSSNNVFLGISAGNLTTTGDSNSGFGFNTLNANIGGSRNTAVGAYALENNTGGVDNVAIGVSALQTNSGGSDNIGVGYHALLFNGGGNKNVAVGSNVLQDNNADNNSGFGHDCLVNTGSGHDNCGFGLQALNQNTSSSYNSAFGSTAGKNQPGNTGCSYFGYGADATANGLTNATAIGYNATVATSNTMVLGNACDVVITSAKSLKFNDTANTNYVAFKSAGTLSGNTTWTLPLTDGTAGQVLETDGAGNLSFASVSSTTSVFPPTYNNQLISVSEGYNQGGFGGGVVGSQKYKNPITTLFFDTTAIDSNSKGFIGGAFDGRYIYLCTASTSIGQVTRYDTTQPFSSSSSYSVFNTTSVNGASKAFAGAIYDGRYVYFIPKGSATPSGLITRYDTTQPFSSSSSYSFFNSADTAVGGNTNSAGFIGAVFDGRYIYYVPYGNGGTNGQVTRYDTTLPFDNSLWPTTPSYSFFDTATLSSNSKGFTGGTFDGRYVYFAPTKVSGVGSFNGQVTRYDTTQSFTSSGSYTLFDTTSVNGGSAGFSGAVFDGRYVYYVPNQFGASGQITRYDTLQSFTSTSSYKVFDTASLNANSIGFSGAVFDGKYIYYIPNRVGITASGQITIFDVTKSFTSSLSYSFFDTAALDANSAGFQGGIYDGKYVYLIPFQTTVVSGQITRIDSYSGPPQSSLLPIPVPSASDSTCGLVTLNGTTEVTVSTTAASVSSIILVCHNAGTHGGSPTSIGALTVCSIVEGVSFNVVSTNVLDLTDANWYIINP